MKEIKANKDIQKQANNAKYILQDFGTSNRRRRCYCYSKISEESGRSVTAKKSLQTRWRCIQCDKYNCMICFTESHLCTKWYYKLLQFCCRGTTRNIFF
nr:unnamed protein product [Callosobruchus chinensis]